MSRIAVTLLALILFGAVLAAADAQSPRPTRETGRPSDKGPDADGNSTTHRDARRAPGRLTMEEGVAMGRYVSFELDLPLCVVRDLRVYGMLLVSQITLPASDCRVMGGGPQGRLEMRGEGTELRIHDAPNALIQFSSDNESVELLFDAAIGLQVNDTAVEFVLGNLTGRVFSKNATSFDLDGQTLFGTQGSILVHPASGTSPERREIFDAIQKGKVGAETRVLYENGSMVSEVLTYDNVSLKVRRLNEERFDFTVDGNLSQGRVFITNIDPGAWDPERVRIDYADVDGGGDQHPVLIRQADRLEDVLDFDPGKGPVYFVFEDEEGWHAAVAVPTFSVHVFQMVGLPLEVVPLLLYGVVIGGLFFVAGGVGIVLERRARNR